MDQPSSLSAYGAVGLGALAARNAPQPSAGSAAGGAPAGAGVVVDFTQRIAAAFQVQ